MFSTLRQRKSATGHTQYILEPTASYLKRTSHKISRLACVYCRSKKIKCTGDEQGCQRCQDKGIVCSYTSATRTDAGGSPRKIVRSEQRMGTTSRSGVRPTEGVTTFRNIDIPAEIDPQLAWDSVIASSDLLHTDAVLDHVGIGLDTYDTFEASTSVLFDPFPTIETVNSVTATSGTVSETTNSDPPSRECLCSKMLEVYEMAEIGLARVQRTELVDASECNTTSFTQPLKEPVDELRWQKEVLKNCETWLSRDASHIQSQHAMLMVSIFDRLLASLLCIAASSIDRHSGHAFESPEPLHRRSSYLCGEDWSCQDARNTLEDSQWKEDDEEMLHVLKSLLSFRASRLKGLLQRLVAIAASNQWLTQTAMVQDLLDRLSKQADFS